MTAPTSPGVVPADVLVAAREALAAQFECSVQAFPYHPKRIRGGLMDHTYEIKAIIRAIMADRANRPSLTEAEREQVRREALEEAALLCDVRICEQSRKQAAFYAGSQDRLGELSHARHCEAFEISAAIRALADRSEPRQEKEGSDA